MAGINFNDLPKNLQAKLQPYLTVGGAKTVEEAIAQAKDAKVWTETDEKTMKALNGGANWGKVMDEFAFDSSKADQYKADMPRAQKENQLAQARKKNSQQNVGKTIGKYVGAGLAVAGTVAGAAALAAGAATLPAWAPLAAIGAGVLLFTSCQNDVNVEQNNSFEVKMISYKKDLEDLKQAFKELQNQQAQQYLVFLNRLDTIISNQNYTAAQIENLAKDIEGWLEEIVSNQISIQFDNNKNAASIIALLEEILKSNGTAEEKLESLMGILKQIKSVGDDILAEIKKAKQDLISTLNTNNSAVINAINKLDENDQQSLNVLNQIKALVETYGSNGNALAEAILTAIGNITGDADLSKVEALLEKLVGGQKTTNAGIANMTDILVQFSAKNQEQLDIVISKLDKINAAIEKLGVDIKGDLVKILNKIPSGGQAGKDYSEVLDAILKKLDGIQKDNNNNFAAVLKAIGNIDIKPQDLSWIKSHLDAILEAIKDHDVIVKVEGGKCCCCDGNGNPVHEGVLGDLNNLLG